MFLRAALENDERAQSWLERVGSAAKLIVPDLIWLEIANGVRQAFRARLVSAGDADAILERVARFPAETRSLLELLPAAWALSKATRLTPYDASYLALARAANATLVTFDRDFRGLYDRLELLA